MTSQAEQVKVLPFITRHLGTIVIGALLLSILRARYLSPLRRFPGPFIASFSRLWQVWVQWTGHAEEHYVEAHRRYGRIVRIGPNELSFASPEAARTIFKTGAGFHKTEFYTIFLPNNTKDIFTEIREDLHAIKKRYSVVPYNMAAVQAHTSQIEALLLKLLEKLDGFEASYQEVDLASWLHYLAFDVLGEFAFAQSFGFLDAGCDVNDTIQAISDSTYTSCMVGQVPFLEALTRSNPLLGYLPAQKSKVFILVEMATQVFQKFQSNPDNDKEACLLKSLLAAHKANPDRFSVTDVLAISMGAIGAGSDSTASTMASFCWHVVSRPHVYEKLTAEIMDASLSDIVQYQEALELPYFQACLKEVMRYEPAVGTSMRRKVPKDGAEIDGEFIAGDTLVSLNEWVLHHDKAAFGDDANQFKPERWLDASSDEVKRMERAMFHFGGGTHLCIGRHLALFELNRILPQVFRRYKIRLVDPTKFPEHETGFFYIPKGVNVYLEKR